MLLYTYSNRERERERESWIDGQRYMCRHTVPLRSMTALAPGPPAGRRVEAKVEDAEEELLGGPAILDIEIHLNVHKDVEWCRYSYRYRYRVIQILIWNDMNMAVE